MKRNSSAFIENPVSGPEMLTAQYWLNNNSEISQKSEIRRSYSFAGLKNDSS